VVPGSTRAPSSISRLEADRRVDQPERSFGETADRRNHARPRGCSARQLSLSHPVPIVALEVMSPARPRSSSSAARTCVLDHQARQFGEA
jgi:hypothetical protein